MITLAFSPGELPSAEEARQMQRILDDNTGIKVQSVSVVNGDVLMDYSDASALVRALEDLKDHGFDVPVVNKHYDPLTGMSCASCVANVGRIALSVPGMIKAVANIPANTLDVAFIDTGDQEKKLRALLSSAGYQLPDVDRNAAVPGKKQSGAWQRLILAALLGIPVIALNFTGFLPKDISAITQAILMLLMVAFPANRFFIKAIRQLKFRATGMDTLVALSTGIAVLFSLYALWNNRFSNVPDIELPTHFHSAAMILLFVLLGKWLEERAHLKAVASMKGLLSLRPDRVTRATEGGSERVDPEVIIAGDKVQVATGERIGVDGVVVSGSGAVDESLLTGESLPVDKASGDKVIGGSLLLKGQLVITASGNSEASFLSQVIRRVRQAQAGKVRLQVLADRVAGIFVPVVLILALITFGIWFYTSGTNGWYMGLLHALTVLVVACPCALGLATPVALSVAAGRAAENGIILKNANSFEKLHRTTHIVFDKTGTLTTGNMAVSDMLWTDDKDMDTASIWLAMEQKSIHPVAMALVTLLNARGANPVEPTDYNELAGKGVRTVVDGEAYFAGSPTWFQEMGVILPGVIAERSKGHKDSTAVYFGTDKKILAAAWLTDEPRPVAKGVLRRLKQQGYKIYLATGDKAGTANALANVAGIDANNVYAEMTPDDKINFVRALQRDGARVLMTGDGVNDAPALVAADVSVAMKTGTGIAQEHADLTLGNNDLRQLEKAILLSKKTISVIRQNLFWAFAYNVLALPAASGLIPGVDLPDPGYAALAMSMSSLIVTLNSLRIGR